jgi:hypothetical protein
MLSHFARKNAQFVARFYSFDYETSHCDVSAAQGDAGVWALILNPPINQNLQHPKSKNCTDGVRAIF